MGFDLQWLLLGLPVAFALGWLASRLDLRQWRSEQRSAPRAYFKGLNLLLNEQQDKAIDVFIEAVQSDPDTTELHFALGNLFRRRGEFERAVRVHQHLLERADLPVSERQRAQNALAEDFMKAGLFDRAEDAYRALEGTAFDTEARLARLSLYERSRQWRAAADVAAQLERSGTGSYAARIAHYWCELAQEAELRQDDAAAADALQQAREVAPQAARPWMASGRRLARQGQHAQALAMWTVLLSGKAVAFDLIAEEYASSALACGQGDAARAALQGLYAHAPGLDLLHALDRLDDDPQLRLQRRLAHLRGHPSLAAASAMLSCVDAPKVSAPDTIDVMPALREAIERAARPLQRYRCAACGFEAQHYFWQCPACLGWDTYPPRRIEEL